MWSKKVNEEEGVASMAQFEKFFIQIKEKYLQFITKYSTIGMSKNRPFT